MTDREAPADLERPIAAGDIRLEPQTAAHAVEMYAVLRDPAIYEYENEPPPSLDWLRERFGKLESRRSPDGRESWLNWVVRLPSGEAVGYVQATVRSGGRADIAYILGSRHWGRGIATRSVRAMIDELTARHGVTTLQAVFKRNNRRSARLLERLGFSPAAPDSRDRARLEPDEALMERCADGR